MSIKEALFTSISIAALFAFCMIPILWYQIKKRNAPDKDIYVEQQVRRRYNFYISHNFTYDILNRIMLRFRALSCLSEGQIIVRSVKLFERLIIVSVLVPIVITIATQNLVLGLFSILVSKIYYTTSIDKAINKLYLEVVQEVSVLLQSITLNYLEFHNVPKSILEAKRGYYLSSFVDKIYDILTTTNSYEKLKAFIDSSPLKILCELAEVCEVTQEYGDYKDEKGVYKFIEQLEILQSEVNLELRVLNHQKLSFRILDLNSLIGVVMLPLVEKYMLSNMPGTSLLLKGFYGLVAKVVLILVTAAVYWYITKQTNIDTVNTNDCPSWVYSLSNKKKIKKIVDAVKAKTMKQLDKLNDLFEASLTNHTRETFYTEKIVNFSIFTVLGLVLTVVFLLMARHHIYNSITPFAITPNLYEADKLEDIKHMDELYMEMSPEERPQGEELASFIDGSIRGLNDLDISNQKDRLEMKLKMYNDTTFKPHYILVIYLIGILGWFIPNFKLKIRKTLVLNEANADAEQLQTVMISIAGTGMSVYEVLYRLMDLSTVHKSAISYATQTFIKNPEESLNWLHNISGIAEFKSLTSKLERSIYNISIKDAFKDTVMEKNQTLSIKEQNKMNFISGRAAWCKLLSKLPAGLCFLLMVLVPIAYLGITQLVKSLSVVGQM